MDKYYLKLIVVLIIGLGIVGLLNNASKKEKQIVNLEVAREASAAQEYKSLSKFEKLLRETNSIKCEFEKNLPSSTMKGTIYVYQNLIRADINAPDRSGELKLSHTLFKDGFSYTWFDKDLTGYKVKLNTNSSDKTDQEQAVQALNNTFPIYEDLPYDCTRWESDKYMFLVPPQVTFIDSQELMEGVSKQLCLKCEEETDAPSRILCKKNLKCK